jgi:hypothetical protein
MPAPTACKRFARRASGRTLVEHHRDVRAEERLHPHRLLGCQALLGAVEVRAKSDALVVDVAELGERKDLIAPAVGQRRVWPRHEASDAAEAIHSTGRTSPTASMATITDASSAAASSPGTTTTIATRVSRTSPRATSTMDVSPKSSLAVRPSWMRRPRALGATSSSASSTRDSKPVATSKRGHAEVRPSCAVVARSAVVGVRLRLERMTRRAHWRQQGHPPPSSACSHPFERDPLCHDPPPTRSRSPRAVAISPPSTTRHDRGRGASCRCSGG